MSNTQKQSSDLNFGNAISSAFNDTDKSITTAGFLVGRIGHKIERSDVNSTTEDYSYFDNGTLLYTLRIVYSDSTKSVFVSAERIA